MYRVFLIDDESWAMVTLEHLIDWQSLGFEIAGKIDNARTAWERIQKEKPDVIITDIRMPGLSGLELLSRIHEAELPVEVVLVSAFADFAYAQEAIRKGAFEYLLKPVRRDKFADCIEHLAQKLEKQNAQRELEDSVVRREIFARSGSLREAFNALSSVPCAQGDALAVIRCSQVLDELLCEASFAAQWPRIPLGNGEVIYLYAGEPGCAEANEQLCHFCMARGITGGFGLVLGRDEPLMLEPLLWLSKNAQLTARFIGVPGVIAISDARGSAQAIELMKALQYNQKAIVLTCLESLRREIAEGRLLLDKLFTLLRNLDSFYRNTLDKSALFPADWKQYSDLLRDYPTCEELFDYLNRILAGDPDEALLSPVLQEIEVHYACNRTLSDLGQELGVSQGHLSQLIRRCTGKTYSELVQERRMEKAKELLAYSEKAVMDIAIEVGYSDQFYFSKLFKRLWGVSPNTWRKHFRSGDEITKKEMK